MKFKKGDRVLARIGNSVSHEKAYGGIVIQIAEYETNYPIFVLIEKDNSPTPFATSEIVIAVNPNDIMKNLV